MLRQVLAWLQQQCRQRRDYYTAELSSQVLSGANVPFCWADGNASCLGHNADICDKSPGPCLPAPAREPPFPLLNTPYQPPSFPISSKSFCLQHLCALKGKETLGFTATKTIQAYLGRGSRGVGNFISNTYSLRCHHQNDSALRWAVV